MRFTPWYDTVLIAVYYEKYYEKYFREDYRSQEYD